MKIKREIINDIRGILPDAGDHDAASFFESVENNPGEKGFRDRGCMGAIIMLPGPKEAACLSHLHIEERYSTTTRELTFYRYEICWAYDPFIPEFRPDDYIREVLLQLRRGIRFDHHPKVGGTCHSAFHWHPNGCSEFRLATKKMTPLKTVLMACLMFSPDMCKSLTGQALNALVELKKEIGGLA